jgi:hypothetical protein
MMAKYMGQLQKMNQYDQAFESSVPGSRARTARACGRKVEDGIESTARHNPGNTESEILNTTEQANGRMKKLMRWDIDTGKMMIMRGGEWRKNEETGEDEYVGFEMEAAGEWENVDDVATRKAAVWSEPTEVAYDDVRFGGAENNLLQNKLTEIGDRLVESATDNEFNGMWELHKETLASELHGFLSSEDMDENAFKDFYFGGFSYDYSNNRMTASAPAFQLLMEEDIKKGNYNEEDGWKDGFGPGTKDWTTKLEVLKRQNFSAGSKFRTDQEPKLLQILTDKYDHARGLYEKYERSKPRARTSSTTKTSDSGVDLPWQKGFDKPSNVAAVAAFDLVQDVLSGRKEVPFGNDLYNLQKNGKYKLVGERTGGKGIKVVDEDELTKTQLIQRFGGIYGNIPDDYFDITSIDHDNMSPTPNIESSKYLIDIQGTNNNSRKTKVTW